MSQIKLRPYQEAAFEKTLWYFDHGGQKPLISMATGLGKAYLSLAIGVEVGGYRTDDPLRVLFLAHKNELIMQPYNSLGNLLPSIRGKYYGKTPARGVVRANRNEPNARFVFSTMQTASVETDDGHRIDEILSYGAFDLVILDEAHHAPAPSYRDVILPKIFEKNPDTKLLGLTATPSRTDGEALDTVFDEIIFAMNILRGVNAGWLKPIDARRMKTEIDLSGVKRNSYGTDLRTDSLASALRMQNAKEIVTESYFENDGPSRYAFVFMPDVLMGREQCEDLRNNGIPAASIDSEMVIDENGIVYPNNNLEYDRARKRVLEALNGGDIRVVGGFDVLTEGVDAPIVDMILQGRPTESETLLTQIIGRGLRHSPGVSRILRDDDDSYLVQKNGDTSWLKYAEDKIPYSTNCLVLDLTTKNTSILLAGSLAGNVTPKKEVSEKEVVEIYPSEPPPSVLDEKFNRGKGTHYIERNFFRRSDENWTIWDDVTMSTYLGALGPGKDRIANALFIYPRQKMMVSRMDEIMQIIEQLEGKDCEIPDETMYQQYGLAQQLKDAFNCFLLFTLQNIPVTVTVKNGFDSEWVQWNSSQIVVQFGDENGRYGRHVDHNAVWEAALPVSQRLTVGGFFVEKNRTGAKKKASSAQLDLLLSPTFKNGRSNMFHTLPEYVNNKLSEEPGLELFRIEKPSRKSLIDDTNIQISGRINHIGIYSAVMKQKLGSQLLSAQRMYNLWTALWSARQS